MEEKNNVVEAEIVGIDNNENGPIVDAEIKELKPEDFNDNIITVDTYDELPGNSKYEGKDSPIENTYYVTTDTYSVYRWIDGKYIEVKNFDVKYDKLSKDFVYTLPEEDKLVYEAAVYMQENPDADIFEKYKNEEALKDIYKLAEYSKEKNQTINDALKEVIDIRASQLAIQNESSIMNKAFNKYAPSSYAKTYFETNDILNGLIPDKNGKYREVPEKKKEIYLKSLDIEDIIKKLDDPKFIKKSIKDSSDVRFKRHASRVNFFLRQYYKNSNLDGSSVVLNCNKSVDAISNRFKISKRFARAYYIAISELSNTWEPYDIFNAEYVYFCNLNAVVALSIKDDDIKQTASESKFLNSFKFFFDKLKEKRNVL